VFIGALLLGLGILLAGIVPGSGGRLGRVRPLWIATAVIAELVAIASYAGLFHGVFSVDAERVTLRRSVQIAVGELGAFAVVPSGAGGPVIRVWALMACGMKFATVMVRSVIHGVIFNLPYILVAALLGLGVLLGVGPGHAPVAVALAPLGLVLLAALMATAAAVYARRHKDSPDSRLGQYGVEIVRAVPAGLRELPAYAQRWPLLLCAVGYWAGDCGVLVLAFHAVHGAPGLGVIVLAYLLGQLGNALPLPGGVGGVEPLMLGVFTASGVNLGLAAAAVLLYRFVSLGLQAVTGTIAVTSLAPILHRVPR
jgi:uncharacterized membrane protein YbhN (UPF0104 family)